MTTRHSPALNPSSATPGCRSDCPAATDEHTLILGHIGTWAVNPFIFPNLPYDPIKDFTPISLTSKVPSLYVVHPDLPVKNLKEFVACAKTRPGQLNHGSAGNGRAGHLAFKYLKMVTETFMLHVPYRGTGPMLTNLLSGRLQAASRPPPGRIGRGTCIATGTTARLPQLPDVPTVAEQGYKGYEMTPWYGLMALSKLPRSMWTSWNRKPSRPWATPAPSLRPSSRRSRTAGSP